MNNLNFSNKENMNIQYVYCLFVPWSLRIYFNKWKLKV